MIASHCLSLEVGGISFHKNIKILILLVLYNNEVLFTNPQKEWPLPLLSEIYVPPISPVL